MSAAPRVYTRLVKIQPLHRPSVTDRHTPALHGELDIDMVAEKKIRMSLVGLPCFDQRLPGEKDPPNKNDNLENVTVVTGGARHNQRRLAINLLVLVHAYS